MSFKKIMGLMGAGCAIMGLSACADHVQYAHAIRSWQGAPEHALYQSWGNPTSEKKLAHGNRLVMYRVVDQESVAKHYAPGFGSTRISPQSNNMLSRPSRIMPHHNETFWCETSFEINHAGVIVNTHFNGNNCVASQESAKKWTFHH